ncbi:MAG: hypothetical protein AB7N24_06875 [Dehalococcoidia bacterium]
MDVRTAARLTFELNETGIEIMRMNLTRRYPDESTNQIERRLVAWLRERPGAEQGDSDGRPSQRFLDR